MTRIGAARLTRAFDHRFLLVNCMLLVGFGCALFLTFAGSDPALEHGYMSSIAGAMLKLTWVVRPYPHCTATCGLPTHTRITACTPKCISESYVLEPSLPPTLSPFSSAACPSLLRSCHPLLHSPPHPLPCPAPRSTWLMYVSSPTRVARMTSWPSTSRAPASTRSPPRRTMGTFSPVSAAASTEACLGGLGV